MRCAAFLSWFSLSPTLLCAVSFPAQAQAPLSIQQLLVESRRWQVSAAFDTASIAFGGFEERSERALGTSLRYGLTPRLEVNGRYSHSRRRLRSVRGSAASEARALDVGVNWLAREEDRWPALLLELRATPWDTSRAERPRLAGGAARATLYQTIDPVVLSLGVSYAYRRGKDAATSQWRLEPLVSFAVNPRVTLLGGFSYGSQSRAAGPGGLPRGQQFALRSGLGFVPRPGSTLFLVGDLAGDGASRVSLQWFYEF